MQAQDPRIAWISIASVSSGHILWMVRGGISRQHFLPATDMEMRNRIAALGSLVGDPDSPPEVIRTYASEVGQSLFGAFARDLEAANTIVIDADESFASVPWPALELRGRALVDTHAIVLTHGWNEAFLRLRREHRSGETEHPLLVRNPQVSPSVANQFPALMSADHETAYLRTHKGIVERQGRIATASEILARLDEADLFHFTGHGFAWGSAGALVVAPEKGEPFGLLAASEIRKRDWSRLRLVVLASCTSAGGELRANPNFESVARAFLEGGAYHVVASRWNIDSISTADIVESFYASLSAGKTAATALQSAMLATKSRQETSHPYYWAGLALHGAL